MADYWKSQPRKFCQYCKCWIADNKPSIEFHERGKNHKENVAAKIEEIKKKSIAKAKQEEKMSKEFAKMEEAALKAYQEDLKRMQAESGESLGASEAPAPKAPAPKAPAPKAQTKPKKHKVKVRTETSSQIQLDVWVEGITDDGNIYYYNTITGESQWDKPEGFQGESASLATSEPQVSSGSAWMEAMSPDGYMYYYNTETGESSWEKPDDFSPRDESPSEETGKQEDPCPPQPESLSGEEHSSESPKDEAEPVETKPKVPKISFRKRKEEPTQTSEEKVEEKKTDEEEKGEEEEDNTGVGEPAAPVVVKEEIPAKKPRKINPYGAWEQIQPEEDPYEKVDLQLPQVDTGATASAPAEYTPEPKAKFKERTITSLGDEGSAEATFKKRKTENGKSRSIRQRGKDD